MRFLIAIMIFLPMLCMAQGNLVPNPSFEEYSDCPNNGGEWWYTPYWNNANGSSPDYFNVCSLPDIFPPDTFPRLGVPLNLFGQQDANSGHAYMGLYGVQMGNSEWREYVQIELTKPLHHRVRYAVSFYVSLSESSRYAVSTLGAHLSVNAISSNDLLVLDAVPQILPDPLQPITDTIDWVLITDTMVSTHGGERFITIGNFFSDLESDTFFFNPEPPLGNRFAYYYIDDVSVIALDSVPNGIMEQAEENGFTVYPNPSNGILTIEYSLGLTDVGTAQLFDLSGRCVHHSSLIADENLTKLGLSHVSSGLYLLRITVNGDTKLSEQISIVNP